MASHHEKISRPRSDDSPTYMSSKRSRLIDDYHLDTKESSINLNVPPAKDSVDNIKINNDYIVTSHRISLQLKKFHDYKATLPVSSPSSSSSSSSSTLTTTDVSHLLHILLCVLINNYVN